MESYEVLRQAFKRIGCKRVAQELHLSPSLIHQWSRGQQGKSAAVNPLDRLLALHRLTGDDRLLDFVCDRTAGRFVPAQKLPALMRDLWTEMKKEMEQILRSAIAHNPAGSSRNRPGGFHSPAEGSRCRPGGSHSQAEGFRCRYRRPGGRCGFRAVQRN